MKELHIGDITSSHGEADATVSFVGGGDLNYDIQDLPSTNIIDLFAQSNDFCKPHNIILFKCQAGMSRSCAFLVAYLIGVESLSLKDALSYCKNIRPQMSINKGFMYQLQLYEAMKGEIDIWNPEYRKFKAWITLQNREQSKVVTTDFGKDPEQLDKLPDLPIIKCKQCRRKLAIFMKGFDHQKCGGSIVVEPLAWMEVTELQGKLNCPRCNHKIGFYLWQGRQCSCGNFVAPYFTLSPNKVDIFQKLNLF